MDDPTREQIPVFFDRFARAFATFDAHRVAQLFVAPGVALREDGSLKGFTTRDDIATYYREALERYHASGCRSCRWSKLTVTELSTNTCVATVDWDLLDHDGGSLKRWRQAYFMARFGGEWGVFGSTFVSQ